MTSCSVKICDLELHYRKVGNDGRNCLILHGMWIDHQVMLDCLGPIFSWRMQNNFSQYQCYYLDLPGMGKSPAPLSFATSDQILQVLEEFIDKIFQQQPFVLVGLSYGGYLAQALVQRRREQVLGLCLLAPVVIGADGKGPIPPFLTIQEDQELTKEINSFHDRLVSEEYHSLVIKTREVWDSFAKYTLDGIRNADPDFIKKLGEYKRPGGYYISKWDWMDKTPFTRPTLILTGRQDYAVGYENALQLQQLFPRSTFAIIDGAGHNIQFEQRDLFRALVNSWLNLLEINCG